MEAARAALLVCAALWLALPSARAGDIHDAIERRAPAEVEAILLSNPGLSSSVDRRGMSALVMAVHQAAKWRTPSNPERMNAVEIVGILVRAGADCNQESTVRFSSKLADTCVGMGAALPADMAFGLRQFTPAVLAALCGVHEAIELFGADGVNAKAGSWVSPLAAAALMGHERAVKALLELGANVEDPGPENRRTPLLVGAAVGDPAVLRALLHQGGAQVDGRNVAGITPLMAAVFFSNLEAVKVLLKAGANVREEMRIHTGDARMKGRATTLNVVEMAIAMRFLDVSSSDAGNIDILLQGAYNDREADLLKRREMLTMVMSGWAMETNMNSLLPGYELDEEGRPTQQGGSRSRHDEF